MVGNWQMNDRRFNGKIREIEIVNKVLSHTEIIDIYNEIKKLY